MTNGGAETPPFSFVALRALAPQPFEPACFGVPLLLCFENGEAACVSFGFSFFGFFFSRLLRCWPLAMT
jgi:hypothetical protein